ncbi:hypothetical protein ACOSQ3_014800 [Xanthoceras sorbifolium]
MGVTCKIVAVTSRGTDVEMEDFVQAGVDFFHVKPCIDSGQDGVVERLIDGIGFVNHLRLEIENGFGVGVVFSSKSFFFFGKNCRD